MSTQHTPGPWRVIDFGSGGIAVASQTSDICGIHMFSQKERLANAELIARAPELLAENERLKAAIRSLHNLANMNEVPAELIRKITTKYI